MALLVAITSARRARELCALSHEAPFLQFHKEKVTLYTDIYFPSKDVSDFHMSQPIVLPIFYLSPTSDLEKWLHCLMLEDCYIFLSHRQNNLTKQKDLFVTKDLVRFILFHLKDLWSGSCPPLSCLTDGQSSLLPRSQPFYIFYDNISRSFA